jgi:hypothetical protein
MIAVDDDRGEQLIGRPRASTGTRKNTYANFDVADAPVHKLSA